MLLKCLLRMSQFLLRTSLCLQGGPDRKGGINLISLGSTRDQLVIKLMVLDIKFPVRAQCIFWPIFVRLAVNSEKKCKQNILF
jgi:hypothetical protein